MSTETQRVDVLAVMDRARDVLAETYAKYQTKIGPFASQSQQSNVELRIARDAVAELIEAVTAEYHTSVLTPSWPDARKRVKDALARVGGAA